MNFTKIAFGGGLVLLTGLGLGFYLNGKNHLAITVGISATAGVAVGVGASKYYSNRELERLKDSSNKSLERAAKEHEHLKATHVTLSVKVAKIEQLKDGLISDKANLQATIKILNKDIENLQIANKSLDGRISGFSDVEQKLKQQITDLQIKIVSLSSDLENSENRLSGYLEDYDNDLAEGIEKGFQKKATQVINREIAADKHITEEAIKLLQDYKDYVEELAELHFQLRDQTLDVNSQAASHIKKVVEENQRAKGLTEEHAHKLELDNAALKQQISGEILIPEKSVGKFGWYYTIANSFIDYAFEEFQVCLKFLGLDDHKGSATVGFGYSASSDPQQLAGELKSRLNVWVQAKGIHSADIKIAKTYPAIEVTFVKDAPKIDESSLYRTNEEFKKMIVKSRIFLRLMGKPESGKTPTALCIADWLCSEGLKEFNTGKGRVLPHTVISACNPLKGISRKSNSDLDVFTVWNDNDKAFKGLIAEYEYRRKPENASYKDDVGFIWLFDEYDNAVRKVKDKNSLTTLPEVLSDGGHINMGAIVLGQGGNVSKLKIQAEDVKLFKNIILDAVTMKSFLEKYGDLYYDDSTIADALKTIDQLEKLASEKNKTITDTARKFRYCMVLNDRSPVFYQLPYFDQTDIDGLNYQTTLDAVEKIKKGSVSKNTQNSVFTNINSTPVVEVETDKPPCKYCGSPNVKRNGKHPKTGKQQYTCNDCKQSPRKWTLDN